MKTENAANDDTYVYYSRYLEYSRHYILGEITPLTSFHLCIYIVAVISKKNWLVCDRLVAVSFGSKLYTLTDLHNMIIIIVRVKYLKEAGASRKREILV